jgi:hypothetical protein
MIKAMRLFKVRVFLLFTSGFYKKHSQDEPKWTPINRDRSTDANPYRVDYLKSIVVN